MRQFVARSAVRFAAFAAFGVTAPAIAHAQDLSCQAGDVEVRGLEFTGNRAFSDGELALWVTTTPSSWFRRTTRVIGSKRCLNRQYLSRDITDLVLFYNNRGYYETRVDTTVRQKGRGVVVSFAITEGRPTILSSYNITGLDGLPGGGAAYARAMRLRVGQPFDQGLFIADIDSITRRLRNHGYYKATTLTYRSRSTDSLTATAEIRVIPGRLMRFGEPVFAVTPAENRAQQLSYRLVERVMGIEPGAPYSDIAVLEAQRSLFDLGIYRNVAVEPLPDSAQPGDSTVVLNVRLAEDYTKHIDSEYGWATLDCGRVRLQYSDLSFLRSARRFEVTGSASKIGFGEPIASLKTKDLCSFDGRGPIADDQFSSDLHYFGGVSLRQPRLLGTKWVPALSIYTERRGEYKAYLRTTHVGADVSFSRPLGQRSQLRFGYSQEYGNTKAPEAVYCALFNRCDEDTRRSISEKATLGIANATFSRFTTDHPVSPTRGTILRVEARTSASPYLGTSESLFFNKLSGDIGAYASLGRTVFSVRVRAGAVTGGRLSDTLLFVPPQERLYAGGATSVRGFQQNELGSVVYIANEGRVQKGDTTTAPVRFAVPDTAGFDRVVPLGGNTLFVANFEVRVPFLLPRVLQLVTFVDGGDVWNRPSVPVIKWTPGFGLSAVTPVGSIQANVGWNAYSRPAGAIYYEDPALTGTAISPLYCVTPGNTIDLAKPAPGEPFQPVPGSASCPRSYRPPPLRGLSRLAFTLSLGSSF